MKYPPPPKRSKKSAAADSMLSSRRASPSPINVPEEANSEQGSLAHVHTLGNDDYTYSDEVGGKARSFPGPLFARRSQLVPLGRKSPVYAESSAYAVSTFCKLASACGVAAPRTHTVPPEPPPVILAP